MAEEATAYIGTRISFVPPYPTGGIWAYLAENLQERWVGEIVHILADEHENLTALVRLEDPSKVDFTLVRLCPARPDICGCAVGAHEALLAVQPKHLRAVLPPLKTALIEAANAE